MSRVSPPHNVGAWPNQTATMFIKIDGLEKTKQSGSNERGKPLTSWGVGAVLLIEPCPKTLLFMFSAELENHVSQTSM